MLLFLEKSEKTPYDKFFAFFCVYIVYLDMNDLKLAKTSKNKSEYHISSENIDNDNACLDHKHEVADFMKNVAKKYTCNSCDYNTSRKYNYDLHLSSVKHKKKLATLINTYNCGVCKYKTINKYNYDKHIFSIKHKNNISKIDFENNCKLKDVNQMNNNELFVSIMSEIKNIMREQNQSIIDAVVNNPTTVNNNQINNQQFNLNVFLNETCKDAMNLSDFIDNLHVSMEDMEKTGELGFAKGMSRIIMNNLNAIDVCKRPIHCSDVKRETLYVKNNGVWEKETEERKRTKEIIYKVSCLNEKQLIKWRDLPRNKGYDKSDHKKNDEFTKLVMEINKLREEEINKVITSVSRHVAIDKDKIKMSGYLN
jgi:hypothetical protein